MDMFKKSYLILNQTKIILMNQNYDFWALNISAKKLQRNFWSRSAFILGENFEK
jgi:hypothetical protein